VAGENGLDEIIDMLWVHPDDAEWTPRIKVIPGTAFRKWMTSSDIEVLGFTYHLLGDRRFSIDPRLSLDEYLKFIRHYYQRCFVENPDGEWSDSRWSAGTDLVNILASQWTNSAVPKSAMEDWKHWLADIYKQGSDEIRECLVHATLEHLLERGIFRQFLADWAKDPVLRTAYTEALEWYAGGGRTGLGKSEDVQPLVRSQLHKSRIRK